MIDKFQSFYDELHDLLRKHSKTGLSDAQLIGGLESAKTYVEF